jgi:hypothetical protein
MAQVQFDAERKIVFCPLADGGVVGEGFRELLALSQANFYALKKFVGMVTTQTGFAGILFGVVRVLRANMLEIIEAAYDHFAASGGAVMFEHLQQGLEKKVEVGIGEAGALGESRRDIPFGGIEGIGDDVFVAHGPFLLGILLFRHGASGDGDFKWRDRVERLTEGELHWTANLTERRTFHHVVTGRQDTTKGADIEKLATEPVLGPLGVRLSRYSLLRVLGSLDGFLLLSFYHPSLLDENVKAVGRVAFAGSREHFNEVADFPFEANIRDDASIGVGIKTRHVTGIGITVRVAIRDFKQEQEVVSIGQDVVAHGFSLSLFSRLLNFRFGVRVVVFVLGLASGIIGGCLLIEADGKPTLRLKIERAREGGRRTGPFRLEPH